MTTIRYFCCNDLLRFSSVNLDHRIVTTNMYLYINWIIKFPNYSYVAIAPGNQIMGYLLGGLKVEDDPVEDNWHGLTIFLNVASDYRRQKLGTRLMRLFEEQMLERKNSMLKRKNSTTRDAQYDIFVYVGVFNVVALKFFTKIGYKYVATLPNFYFKKYAHDALEMTKEIAEETLSDVQVIGVGSICQEANRATYRVQLRLLTTYCLKDM